MATHNMCGAIAPGLAAPALTHPPVLDPSPPGAAASAPAGLSPSPNDDATELAGSGGVTGDKKTANLIFEQPADNGKRFATLRAHLALKGYCLSRTAASDGPVCFFVSRWTMLRELRDLAAVSDFAAQVGARNA